MKERNHQTKFLNQYIWVLKFVLFFLLLHLFDRLVMVLLQQIGKNIYLDNMLYDGVVKSLEAAAAFILFLALRKQGAGHVIRESFKKRLLDILIGLGTASFSMLAVFLVFIITGTAKIIQTNQVSLLSICLSAGIYIFVGLTEEIVSRFAMCGILKESGSRIILYGISSILFASMHLGNQGITITAWINLFLAGFILVYMYDKTGSIWMSIGFHTAWNFVQSSAGFSVSGTGNNGALFVLHTEGDPIITGGFFGAEGSIFTSILLLLTILGTHFFFHKKHIFRIRRRKGTADGHI